MPITTPLNASTNDEIERITNEWEKCTKCPRHRRRKSYLRHTGCTSNVRLAIVVDDQTEWDRERGKPLSGPHGAFLAGALGLEDLSDQSLCTIGAIVIPLVACVPRGDVERPLDPEVHTCVNRVHDVLAAAAPEMILTIGSRSTQYLTRGTGSAITAKVGDPQVGSIRGRLVDRVLVPLVQLSSIHSLLRSPDPEPGGAWELFFTSTKRALSAMGHTHAE